jgi:ubiquinone/menaquinone biosynthesis C-methylase UbiE
MKNFDRVSDIYDVTREMPSFVYDRIVDRVAAATRATTETQFLEIGVGTGRITVPFLERGYRFTGVDISERMMDRLRAKVRASDVAFTLVKGDVTQLPFEDASFDVVLAVHILHLVSDWQRAVREARRVLAPSGYLVLGYESSQSDAPCNEMRRQWQTFVTEAGVSLSSRSGNWPTIDADLIEGGSYAAVYRVAHWEEALAPRSVLDAQRSQVFSHSWDVPEDVLETVHQRMVAWATDRFGSLDADLRSEREFLLSVHGFPAGRDDSN